MEGQKGSSSTGLGKKFELVFLWAIAILSVGIAFLDFSGALENLDWLKDRIPTFVFLSVGLLAGYLALERRNQLEPMRTEIRDGINLLAHKQEDTTQALIDSLQGVQVNKFESGDAFLNYLHGRITNARIRIDDVSWRPNFGTQNYGGSAQKLNKRFPNILREAVQRVPYREIMIFNKPGRREKLQSLLEENMAGYSCAYFDAGMEIPLLQFMVLDNEEVIIFGDLVTSSVSIRHPVVVKVFADYFEEAWQRAWKLKIGKTIYWDRVKEVLGDETAKMLAARVLAP